MLDRYSLPEMREIWTEQNKWNLMNEVELAYIFAKVQLGFLPESVYVAFSENVKVPVERIEEIEKDTGHDVIAFVKTAQESLQSAGVAEYGEYHKGLSSYPVQDPANILRLRQANQLIIDELTHFSITLNELASKYKWTLAMAYTHNQNAEPTTFGHLLANYRQQVKARIDKLVRIQYENLCWANLGGAVGTFAGLNPKVCELTASKLGLKLMLSTQIISRDNHAEFIGELAIIAGVIEGIFRTLHIRMHSALHELQEGKGRGYRGSSAMAHKVNCNLTEQLFGLSRVMRGYDSVAKENIETIDYRDISQSAPERIIFPDATALIHYMINKSNKLAEGLVVFEEEMSQRVNESSFAVWATQPVRIALMDAGIPYDAAYLYMQQSAFNSVSEKKHMLEILSARPISDSDNRTALDVLGSEKLTNCFDAMSYIKDGIEFCFQLFEKETTKVVNEKKRGTKK